MHHIKLQIIARICAMLASSALVERTNEECRPRPCEREADNRNGAKVRGWQEKSIYLD